MPNNAQNWLGWILFAAGILCPAIVFTIADLSSHPAWNWDSSFFGQHLAIPLWITGFVCCLMGPALTQLSARWKFYTKLIGIGAYAIVWFVSLVVSILVFGLEIS